MAITLTNCLKLSSLKNAKVVAGASGLENIVVSVSVLEYAAPEALNGNFFRNNELIISAFISIKDDIEAQCKVIRKLKHVGEVGIILYYVGCFLLEIDKKLIETADEIGFPIICMPENNLNLRYSEALCEIMELIIIDRLKHTYFVGEILEYISSLKCRMRTVDTVLRILGDRLRCTLILTDRNFNLLSIAPWSTDFEYDREKVSKYFTNEKNGDFVEINIDDDILTASCQTIISDNNIRLYLILFKQQEDLSQDYCRQAAEVVQLFINIWSKNESNEGTAELFKAIFNDEPVKMRRLAEILNINVEEIHNMWLLTAKNNFSKEILENINSSIVNIGKRFFNEHKRLFITDVFEDTVVVFLDNLPYSKESKSFAQLFINELVAEDIYVFIALCTNLESTTDVRNSYILTGDSFKFARIIFPLKTIYTLQEMEFSLYCYEIINKGEKSLEKILLPLSFLMEENSDSNKELLTTLSVFLLDTEYSLNEACHILFIHKNTVKYRINKINEKLGYSVLKMPENYNLYIAIAVHRLLEGLKLGL